jgi:hypothetical protein
MCGIVVWTEQNWVPWKFGTSASGATVNFYFVASWVPITVAALCKAWTVFTYSNTGIVVSNSTRGVDASVSLFCICVVLWEGRGLATGWSPVQGVLPTVYKLRNWNWWKQSVPNSFSYRQCSKIIFFVYWVRISAMLYPVLVGFYILPQSLRVNVGIVLISLLTYLWSWALLAGRPNLQLLKNFPAFHGTRRFITVFARALHWFLS